MYEPSKLIKPVVQQQNVRFILIYIVREGLDDIIAINTRRRIVIRLELNVGHVLPPYRERCRVEVFWSVCAAPVMVIQTRCCANGLRLKAEVYSTGPSSRLHATGYHPNDATLWLATLLSLQMYLSDINGKDGWAADARLRDIGLILGSQKHRFSNAIINGFIGTIGPRQRGSRVK